MLKCFSTTIVFLYLFRELTHFYFYLQHFSLFWINAVARFTNSLYLDRINRKVANKLVGFNTNSWDWKKTSLTYKYLFIHIFNFVITHIIIFYFNIEKTNPKHKKKWKRIFHISLITEVLLLESFCCHTYEK